MTEERGGKSKPTRDISRQLKGGVGGAWGNPSHAAHEKQGLGGGSVNRRSTGRG